MQFLCLHLLFHLANKPAASLLHRCLGSWRFNLVPHGSCVGGWTASMWERSLEKTQLIHSRFAHRDHKNQESTEHGCPWVQEAQQMLIHALGTTPGKPPSFSETVKVGWARTHGMRGAGGGWDESRWGTRGGWLGAVLPQLMAAASLSEQWGHR